MPKMHVVCYSISVKNSSQKMFWRCQIKEVHSFPFYWKHFQITVLSHCHEHKAVTSFGFLYHFMQIFEKWLWDKHFQKLALSQKLQLSLHAGYKQVLIWAALTFITFIVCSLFCCNQYGEFLCKWSILIAELRHVSCRRPLYKFYPPHTDCSSLLLKDEVSQPATFPDHAE